MIRLFERLVAWALRSASTVMVFAGASVLAAGVPLFGMLTGAAIARTMGVLLFQVSLVFIVAGAGGIYLCRRRQPLLPNEREATSDKPRPAIGGWLLLLPLVLVALPVGLVLRLQPFLAERPFLTARFWMSRSRRKRRTPLRIQTWRPLTLERS
jgi:hypothetical protein